MENVSTYMANFNILRQYLKRKWLISLHYYHRMIIVNIIKKKKKKEKILPINKISRISEWSTGTSRLIYFVISQNVDFAPRVQTFSPSSQCENVFGVAVAKASPIGSIDARNGSQQPVSQSKPLHLRVAWKLAARFCVKATLPRLPSLRYISKPSN